MSPIVLWSAAGGFLLGAIADAVLVGVAVCVGAVVRIPIQRVGTRLWIGIVVAILVAIPLVTATLGLLEGRLKQT